MKYFHPKRWWRILLHGKYPNARVDCKSLNGTFTAYSFINICGEGCVNFNSTKFGWPPYFGKSIIEARNSDATVSIGNSWINNNFYCVAEHGKITIGDDCLIGINVQIINSDFHPISASKRHDDKAKSKDVVIGNNVFIGNNVSICKGVHIGDNAVIANSAVVFDDVKENTIVRGNPAKFYKEIYE